MRLTAECSSIWSFFPNLERDAGRAFLPNVNRPKYDSNPSPTAYTRIVRPAPKNPAPTGEIVSCETENACPVLDVPFPAKSAAHPRAWVCPQALHHSRVVLIPAGWNALTNVDRGTSVSAEPSQPGKRIEYVRKLSSSVPFLKLKRTKGCEDDAGCRTSNMTDAA